MGRRTRSPSPTGELRRRAPASDLRSSVTSRSLLQPHASERRSEDRAHARSGRPSARTRRDGDSGALRPVSERMPARGRGRRRSSCATAPHPTGRALACLRKGAFSLEDHGTRRPQPAAAPKPQSCTSPREVRGDKDQRVLHAPSLTKTAASGAPSRGSRVLTRNLSHRLLFADADENGPHHPQEERAIHHKRRGENVHSSAAPG
jgi:hypothetical protein